MTATRAVEKIEWLTKADAASQLGMKERRLRDYMAAGKIQQKDGLLCAGDVARVQAERDDKKTNAKVRALATMEPEVRKVTKLAETRAALLLAEAVSSNRQLQSGGAAIKQLPNCAWLTIDQAGIHTGLPAAFIAARIRTGALPALDVGVRPGGRYRVKRSDLDALEAVE